ncbi:putative nuclease HARBI1, partial [Eupeodes corollae]|uniref:putative nuclease HARBI1 n=1 Tax=Eupeodes corollae TaxID=290404 RepID=UPI002490F7DC
MDSDDTIMEDLNILEDVAEARRQKVYKNKIEPFSKYDDKEFYRHYRFDKTTARFIIDLLREDIASATNRGGAISSELIVLTGLRYLAAGSYQKDVGDCHNISQQSVSNCVKKFVRALASKARDFIKFPSEPSEIRSVKRKFFDVAGFPQCVGAIDCTHIKIKNPGQEFGARHRCRKIFYSINVQVVCDASQRVTDVVARWRGSAHDSRIWRESSIYHRLQDMDLQGGVILGDSGYPGSKILLTPFRVSAILSEPEQRYNRSHIRTRNHIECLFGQLKNKFRCCFNGIQLNYETAKASIVAICILHNISKGSSNVGFLDGSDTIMPDGDLNQNDDNENDDALVQRRRLSGRYYRNIFIQ